MRSYGKIREYDGYSGVIIGLDGYNYLLLDTELMDDDIKVDDYVSFEAEVYRDVELTKYMARFVKKIQKEDINS